MYRLDVREWLLVSDPRRERIVGWILYNATREEGREIIEADSSFYLRYNLHCRHRMCLHKGDEYLK